MKIFAIDRASLLVHVDARASLAEVEDSLARTGLTLDLALEKKDSSVGEWLESGAPGARSAWLDPADHLVAGFSARLRGARGDVFTVKPAPRRAAGPDLLALLLGLDGRLLAFESVWLRIHRVGVTRPVSPFEDESQESLNEDELRLFAAIEKDFRD
jgi:alkyldihydroxyacetonephosphate synthase